MTSLPNVKLIEIKVGWITIQGKVMTTVPEVVQMAVIDYRAMDYLKEVTLR